jgi:PAS domain S-box-containing protein
VWFTAALLPASRTIGLSAAILLLLIALASAAFALGRRRPRARPAGTSGAAPEGSASGDANGLAAPEVEGDAWPDGTDRYRTPLDQVENYAIILLDTQGRPTSWNPGIRRVLGYEKVEFLRTTAADLYPPEARKTGVPAADLAAADHRGRATVERWLLRKDGSRFFGSLATTSVHDRDGRLLGYARRLRDLSQRKQVEEQLRRKQDALELALEAAGLGTWEHDLQSGSDFLDARAKALFGLAEDEPPTHARWLEAIHPEDRESTLASWEQAVRERSGYSAEYRVVWPDGSVHWVMAVGRCVTDPATHAPLHFTGVVLDLTERRRTEEHLQESLRLEAVGRLAGGIAHDLNNMLAAILGFGDLLAQSFDAADPRIRDVEQISRAASRSATLTRQLLAFARREMIQPRALDINTVVQHALPLLPPTLGENVELELRLAPDLAGVYADPRQIEQILMNLVLNARDAMPRGGRVTIETGTVHLGPGAGAWRPEEERGLSGRFTMLAVTDTGHGMDAATLRRIWEPFFTTKPPGQGTGLGLSSVYGAVKQSGGFVWADSEPGRGTSVQVYWPELLATPEPPQAEAEPETAVLGGTETVLVVEDEDLVRALAVRALQSLGYTCLEARDAEGALLRLQGDPPVDLVISDVVMPGMSGGALGERLARLRPGIPVVYISAFTDEEVIRRGMLGEGGMFLQKPFTTRELARVVRGALDAAAAAREKTPAEP